MKKLFILIVFSLSFLSCALCENLKGEVVKKDYFDYLKAIELTDEQKAQITVIRAEEVMKINPIIIDIESKEKGIELLDTFKCRIFDSKCKNRLKEDKAKLFQDYQELIRRLSQKKNYYELRYRNVLNREQDRKIKKLSGEEKN